MELTIRDFTAVFNSDSLNLSLYKSGESDYSNIELSRDDLRKLDDFLVDCRRKYPLEEIERVKQAK